MRALASATITTFLCAAACDADKPASTGSEASPARVEEEAKDSAASAKTPASSSSTPPGAASSDGSNGPDLDAAKGAFGCEAPSDAAAKRACEGLLAFAKAGAVASDPNLETKLFLARADCTKQPSDLLMFSVAELSSPTPQAAELPDIALRFEGWAREPARIAAAERIIGELRGGKPLSERSPEEVEENVPKSWSAWRENWAFFAAVPIRARKTGGVSLLEEPDRAGAPAAYWRQADRTLVRVSPPAGKWGWCVSHYYPVPD